MDSSRPFDRRRWLLAAGGLWLGACTVKGPGQGSSVPAAEPDLQAELARFRIPGEFETQRCIWLGFDIGLQDTHGCAGASPGTVADPRTVLPAWTDDLQAQQHPVARLNRERMQRHATIPAAAKTVDGQPLRVLRVRMPRIVERPRRLSARAERNRIDAWTADFFPPGRAIRWVDAASLNGLGGGLHCATLHEPLPS